MMNKCKKKEKKMKKNQVRKFRPHKPHKLKLWDRSFKRHFNSYNNLALFHSNSRGSKCKRNLLILLIYLIQILSISLKMMRNV